MVDLSQLKYEKTYSLDDNNFIPGHSYAQFQISVPELKLSASASTADTIASLDGQSITSYRLKSEIEYNGLKNYLSGSLSASASHIKQLNENYSLAFNASAEGNLDGDRSVIADATYRYDDLDYTTEGNQLLHFQTTATVGNFNGKVVKALQGEARWGNDTSYQFAEAALIKENGELNYGAAAGIGYQTDTVNIFGKNHKANIEVGLHHGADTYDTDIDIGSKRTNAFVRVEALSF